MDEHAVAESKAIHRATGPTFYLATRLLPERVRRATYVLYAFFRLADEAVDDPGSISIPDRERRLAVVREAVLGDRKATSPVLLAFCKLREPANIPRREVEAFLDAMETDLTKRRYATDGELDDYMRGSSVAVAYMMLAVMESDDPGVARPHARALGEAFQLTNFLRDVREDVLERDRIYLPESSLNAHGASSRDIERLSATDGVRETVADELRRTEELYRVGVAGIKYLPRDCQFSVLLAAVLYAEHHRLVREQNFDVLTTAPSLATARKIRLCLATARRWAIRPDPEAVFYAVSAISREPSGRSRGSHSDSSAGRLGRTVLQMLSP